jgi:uncharacterized protein YbjT (DUF2867 family)
MDRKRAPVLVLGGTGHYGRHIVSSLLENGEPVRVLSRNAAIARSVLGDRVEIVEGDVTSRHSAVQALAGVRAAVISVSAFSPRLIRKLRLIERDSILMVLEEAKRTGVSRVVYISVYDIWEDLIRKLDLEIGRIKLEIETTLAESDFEWNILGAAYSMEIFFSMIRGESMMVPGGGPPALATVSPVDVGEVTAQTVVRDDLGRKRMRVTGPEAISFPEAARRISEATGRRVKFRRVPLFPLKVASVVTWPFNPFLRHLVRMIQLLNSFPQGIADKVPEDHRRLTSTFSYIPTTIEMQARSRWRAC